MSKIRSTHQEVENLAGSVTPLTILGHPHQADGSGYYRFYLPFKYLAGGVDHRVLMPEPGTHFSPDDEQLEEIDVIAGQRFMNPQGVDLLTRWKPHVKIVYEIDDDILSPDKASGLHHLYDPKVRETIQTCIGMADMLTVSTEPLRDTLKQYNANVRVLPNFIQADMLYMRRQRRDRLTVGWAGGMSHLIDWMEACDPVRDVMDANPAVDMHFVGQDYSPLVKRPCRYTPWSPHVRTYWRAIDFDIGIAPLASTPFNDCKSHIKALEYMALGIPVIASDRPAYHDMVVDGVTGFLVHSADEWRARLTDLINDEAMREEMGKAGHEVATRWTAQENWVLWRDAYETVADWPNKPGKAWS